MSSRATAILIAMSPILPVPLTATLVAMMFPFVGMI
jgi:hypothetical protein